MPLGLFFLPSLSHPSSYVLGCSLGMCHPLLSLRKKDYAEAVARAIPPQPVLVLPPALESLATELFLFDSQHQDKRGAYMFERHKNSLSRSHAQHDFQ